MKPSPLLVWSLVLKALGPFLFVAGGSPFLGFLGLFLALLGWLLYLSAVRPLSSFRPSLLALLFTSLASFSSAAGFSLADPETLLSPENLPLFLLAYLFSALSGWFYGLALASLSSPVVRWLWFFSVLLFPLAYLLGPPLRLWVAYSLYRRL